MTERVKDYLETKKLSLNGWLSVVKQGHCGDIMMIYISSLMKGLQTGIHLWDGKVWSTLHVTSLLHNELIEWCDMHLAYRGFGIFLWLIQCPPLIPQVNILCTLHSDDNKSLQQLVATSNLPVTKLQWPRTSTATVPSAAAGSAAQLEQVEKELRQCTKHPTIPPPVMELKKEPEVPA